MIRGVVSVCLLALLAGCESAEETAAPKGPPEAVAEATPPDREGLDPKGPDTYEVRLDTTEGPVTIAVDRALSPHGADRFYRLVKEGFYDGAKFFRVVSGFVVQFGISGDPKMNEKWMEANIPDDPVRDTNTRGTVTFAKSGLPNSRSTQIFINLGDNAATLDPQEFAPFGRVTGEGMNVVEKFFSDYGDALTNRQGEIAQYGNEYLDKNFPELDAINKAVIVSENGQPVADSKPANAGAGDDSKPADVVADEATKPGAKAEKKDAAGSEPKQ